MTFMEKLYRFINGRYGTDAFYNFLMIIDIILIVINAFLSSFWLSLLIFAVAFYAIYRSMSRNILMRQAENQKYLKIKRKISFFFQKIFPFRKRNDPKTHVFRICPSCKAKIRLPRKKGPHSVSCPRCQVLFKVQIR